MVKVANFKVLKIKNDFLWLFMPNTFHKLYLIYLLFYLQYLNQAADQVELRSYLLLFHLSKLFNCHQGFKLISIFIGIVTPPMNLSRLLSILFLKGNKKSFAYVLQCSKFLSISNFSKAKIIFLPVFKSIERDSN